jgi:hypothetical protein
MARCLVVETEVAIERRVVAQFEQPAFAGEPAQRDGWRGVHRPADGHAASVRPVQRPPSDKCVLDVGEQQLLVLLLVVQAETIRSAQAPSEPSASARVSSASIRSSTCAR